MLSLSSFTVQLSFAGSVNINICKISLINNPLPITCVRGSGGGEGSVSGKRVRLFPFFDSVAVLIRVVYKVFYPALRKIQGQKNIFSDLTQEQKPNWKTWMTLPYPDKDRLGDPKSQSTLSVDVDPVREVGVGGQVAQLAVNPPSVPERSHYREAKHTKSGEVKKCVVDFGYCALFLHFLIVF